MVAEADFLSPEGRDGAAKMRLLCHLPPSQPRGTLRGLMPTRDPVHELQRLERLYKLASDATPLERLLAYEPQCGPAHRQRTVLLRRWGRSVGLESYQP